MSEERKRPLTEDEAAECRSLKSLWERKRKEGMSLTQSAAGDALGISQAAVSHYLNGRNRLNLSAALGFAKFLGADISDFSPRLAAEHRSLANARPAEAKIVGALDPWDDTTPLHDDDVELPLLKTVCLAAGAGLEPGSEDFDGMKLRFSKSTLRKVGVQPECAVCVMVMGNSMEPMLPDGATVGVNTADKAIKDGDIYAINHNGELRVKQLYRLKQEGLRLRSINRDEWEDEDLGAEEAAAVIVIGRVFWWSALR
ncbi:LexA family transcriptional regulator [Isoalcanivorax beigongshangi]|uniref:S24 family peptidase n=1 Tax=Isoalcanivorax beigongshangi TaxID=3238810 RepID=A0ABV4AGD5_9GAMM